MPRKPTPANLVFPPPLDASHIEYVGIIANSWAMFEFLINSTIHILAGVDHETGACMTANIGSIHLRLRTLYALVELRGGNQKLLKEMKNFQGLVSGTADKRNRAIHDPWMSILYLGATEERMSQFVSKADNKGREFGAKVVETSALIEIILEIKKRDTEFMALRDKMKSALPTCADKLTAGRA